MLVYIIFPCLIAVIGTFMCRENSGKVSKAIFCSLFGLSVFLLQSLRSYVGTDYWSYTQLYEYFSYNDDSARTLTHEKGFSIPLEIINEVFPERYIMFALIAAVVAAGSAYYIYKYSSNPCVSAVSFICFGLFFYSMNFMRQFIAGIIIMYAITNIHNKSFFRYLTLILFASCFHWSALVMIPFYFILNIKMESITLTAYIICAVMLAIFAKDIIQFGIDTLYLKYQNDYEIDTGSISYAYIICYGIVFCVAYIFRAELEKRNTMSNIYLSCLFFACMFEMLGTVSAILSRFTLLFIIPPFLGLIPDLLDVVYEKVREFAGEKYKKTTVRLFVCFAAFAFVSCFYGWLLSTNSNGVIPYRTVFEYSGVQ